MKRNPGSATESIIFVTINVISTDSKEPLNIPHKFHTPNIALHKNWKLNLAHYSACFHGYSVQK